MQRRQDCNDDGYWRRQSLLFAIVATFRPATTRNETIGMGAQ
jgi:hypothetical protein